MQLFKIENDGLGKVVEYDEVVKYADVMGEERLEALLEAHIEMIDPDLCVIGRQVETASGRLDLLAVDKEGYTVVIELRRGKAFRDAIGQVLGHVAWVQNRDYNDLNEIAKKSHLGEYVDLRSLFRSKFGTVPETWNEGHGVYVIAFEFDRMMANVVEYLNDPDSYITLLQFYIYRRGAEQFMALRDLDEETDQEPEN